SASLDAAFTTADATAPLISTVSVTSITATGATITWTTNEPATSQVAYGLTSSYGSMTTLDTTLRTTHTVTLTGLSEATGYHYKVLSVDGSANAAASPDTIFTTNDATAPLISAVTATGITATVATISWTTNEAATSQVAYGPTASYG